MIKCIFTEFSWQFLRILLFCYYGEEYYLSVCVEGWTLVLLSNWCVEYFNTLNKTSTIFVERTELQFQLMISAGLPCCIHITCWFTCCVLKNDFTFLILQMEKTDSWRFGLGWNMKYTALPSDKLVRCRNLLTILSKMWLYPVHSGYRSLSVG